MNRRILIVNYWPEHHGLQFIWDTGYVYFWWQGWRLRWVRATAPLREMSEEAVALWNAAHGRPS